MPIADFPKLPTLNDGQNRNGRPIFVLGQPAQHLVQQGLIGQLRLATQRISQELATELARYGLPAVFQQEIAQPREAVDIATFGELGSGVNRDAISGCLTATTDGVEARERETERIDALVAFGARRVVAVAFDQLPFS